MDADVIAFERIRSVLQQAPLTVGVTVINAALTGFVLAAVVSHDIALGWVAANAALAVARLGIRWKFFQRGSDNGPASGAPLSLTWPTLSVLGSLGAGLLWGLGVLLMFPAQPTYQLFLAFVIGGMCAGATCVNSAHWPTVVAFILPASLPLVACFIMQGSTPQIVSALMTVLFASALSLTAWQNHHRFGEHIGLQLALASGQRHLHDTNERLRTEMAERQKAEAISLQAQKMEAVGQLTGGIAHDFNNLLQSMAASLELIQRRPDDVERVRRLADAGLHAASRGAKLTSQLLAFSRSRKPELKPLSVNQLLSDVRQLLDRTFNPAIRVRLDAPADDLHILGDAVQLEMALLNLAINARDAMTQGGELTISARPHRPPDRAEIDDGAYVEISVTDTGPGMPPDVVAHAFDPFFTTKEAGRGSGIGLSQVHETVRRAGGAVSIESQPGVGTSVRLLLRRTNEQTPTEPERTNPAAVNPSSATVLVVDDDPDVRRLLAASLEALGYVSLQAEDGYAAIAAIDRSAPDAVILDFAMPGMNGADVARQVLAKRPRLPIILATGYPDKAALAGDAVPILHKPFRLDELAIALMAVLQPRGGSTRPPDGTTAI